MTRIYLLELFSKCFVEISLLYSQEQYSKCNIDLRFSPQSPHVVRLLPILIYSRGMSCLLSILDHDERTTGGGGKCQGVGFVCHVHRQVECPCILGGGGGGGVTPMWREAVFAALALHLSQGHKSRLTCRVTCWG